MNYGRLKAYKHTGIILRLIAVALILVAFVCILTGCGQRAEKTEILSVELTSQSVRRGKPVIEIRATLAADFVEGHSGTVYLFEVRPYDTAVTSGSLGELEPISSHKIKYGELAFSIPLYEAHASRLTSAFVIAHKGEDGRYTPLTEFSYLSNPELLAEQTSSHPFDAEDAPSVKGLSLDESNLSDAIRLGIKHTVVEVSITDLLVRDGKETDTAHTYCGTTSYFNDYAVARLDALVRAYGNAGIGVILRLGLFDAPTEVDETLRCLYYGTDAVEGVTGYAIRIGDPSASGKLCALFDFLGYRYCSSSAEDRIESFIIGSRVNDGTKAYHSYGADTDRLVKGYHELLRVAYASLAAHYSEVKIYMPLNSDWDNTSELSVDALSGRAFLEAFSALSKSGTDFPWCVAFSAEVDSSLYISESGGIDHGAILGYESDGRRLSLADMSDAISYLSGRQLMYNATEQRSVIIDSATVRLAPAPDVSEELQATLLAYCYVKACAISPIDAFVYSDLYDGGQVMGGLRADGAKRLSYAVYSEIDTKVEDGLINGICSNFGEEFTAIYDKACENGLLSDRINTGGQAIEVDYTKNDYALTVLKDYENGDRSDSEALFGEASSLKLTENGSGVSLCIFYVTTRDTSCGVVIRSIDPASLRKREALAFTLQCDTGYGDTSVILRLEQNGLCYVSQAKVRSNEYGSVMFDIGEFSKELGDGEIVAYVMIAPDDPTKDTFSAVSGGTLCIDAVYSVDVISREKSGFGMVFIVVVIILILIVLVIEIIRQTVKLSRSKSRRQGN